MLSPMRRRLILASFPVVDFARTPFAMTKQFIAYFILLYSVACAVTAGISHLVYQLALREATVKYESRERIYVAGRVTMLDHVFAEIRSDLLFLSDQQTLKSFLSGGTRRQFNLWLTTIVRSRSGRRNTTRSA